MKRKFKKSKSINRYSSKIHKEYKKYNKKIPHN